MTESKKQSILAALAARGIADKVSVLEGDYDLPLAAAIELTGLETDIACLFEWRDKYIYRAGYAFAI